MDSAAARTTVVSRVALTAALAAVMIVAFGCVGASEQRSEITTPPATAVSSPDATATAAFETTNRKLAEIGHATLEPGTDPNRPYANVTYPPSTPWPTPTPGPPLCADTIAGWEEILAQYGPWYEKFGCGPFKTSAGTQIVLMTVGKDGGPGAIVTYTCESTDKRCLKGLSPSAPDAAWSVFPAPYPGGLGIVGGSSIPDCLALGGGHWFNLATHLYDDCR
jgi:hypothetical protein